MLGSSHQLEKAAKSLYQRGLHVSTAHNVIDNIVHRNLWV